MKLILTVIILAGIALAQAPGNWGPGGIPLDWRGSGIEFMEASKFTSPLATSYLSMSGDTLTFALTGASADRDIYWMFEEEDGTRTSIRLDTSHNKFVFAVEARFETAIQVSNRLESPTTELLIDAEDAGAGALMLGRTGDNDIVYINSRLTTNITTVDSTYVMGAADEFMFTMTADDTLKCPITPLAGEVLECKFTHASGGVLSGNGQTIDGAATVTASENDNLYIIWNATTSDWEVR